MLNKGKIWCFLVAAFTVIPLLLLAGITVIVDPYFHYHAPLEVLEYPLDNQRYQNDGIVKHFEYDAIITGTSMTENFHTSDLNRLFDVNSVKIPFSGGSYFELNNTLGRAIEANPEIKMIVRSLDAYMLFFDKDYMHESFDYPYYLYDKNLLNDVEYLLNKDVLLKEVRKVIGYTREGIPTTDFDTYSSWDALYACSKKAVFQTYMRPEKSTSQLPWSDEMKLKVQENVIQNVITLAQENPDIQFYYYYPPYSIAWWDREMQKGSAERQIEALKYASELILEVDNIHLFTFLLDRDTVLNLDNYKDIEHHSGDINRYILECMKDDKFLLAKEDNESYWKEAQEFLLGFDYDAYLEQMGYYSMKENSDGVQ